MYAPFSRLALFLVLCAGFGVLFYGGWIAWRGTTFYDFDPVLMGTGGGLALGGLLVIALTVGAFAQVATARDTAAMRRALEARGAEAPRGPASAGPAAPGAPAAKGRRQPVLRAREE
ncbi:hypothetical protein [Jannaschia sp. W003]|uniref:hypothetical protein n=1 Tax=Jannaschia sp. W003 TaxID=2867012 RepID=UPI0021A29FAC|nr:hypothetical protein [Jannaschia sp. W003]UWQ20920.1 hypothetical protein K3554_13225 [Jannaschia sp. W003]